MFAGIDTEISALQNQLPMIENTLDWGESASFGFLPGESVVRAVKAVWTRDQKEDREDPDGILFLTDQHLIFEQREEIASKKVLFVTTERQKVQQSNSRFLFSVSQGSKPQKRVYSKTRTGSSSNWNPESLPKMLNFTWLVRIAIYGKN